MVLDQKLQIPVALQKPRSPQESQLQPPVLSLCEMWMEAQAGGLQLTRQHCGWGGRNFQGPVRLQLVRHEGKAVFVLQCTLLVSSVVRAPSATTSLRSICKCHRIT